MTDLILDLCGGTGSWSAPYRDAGYRVEVVDVLTGRDVRLLERARDVLGVLAAPPCTEFAGSGARWWARKGKGPLLDGLSIVDACLRIVWVCRPRWWALENPVGRLSRYLGPARMTFQPFEYGDPWSKRTCLWGEFTLPTRGPVVEPKKELSPWWVSPSPRRAALRSVTPPGFAQAFFESNP